MYVSCMSKKLVQSHKKMTESLFSQFASLYIPVDLLQYTFPVLQNYVSERNNNSELAFEFIPKLITETW